MITQLRLTAPRLAVYPGDSALAPAPAPAKPRDAFPEGSAGDDAFDEHAAAQLAATLDHAAKWERYLATYTREPLEALLLPECKPTVFHLRSLTAAQVEHIDSLPKFGPREMATIAYAVQSVDDFQVGDGRGGVITLVPKFTKTDIGQRLDDETMNSLVINDDLRLWLWGACRAACGLTTEARKSDPVP